MAPRDQLTARELFFAGGISGVIECMTVQPFDMAKTRVQLMSNSHSRPGVAAVLAGLVAEGGVPRLYRGILPELVAMTPKSSVMYTTYEATCRMLRPSMGDTPLLHGAAGLASGAPEALVVTPFQVVKIRLQAREHLGRYHGTTHCVHTIVLEEGVTALATGLHVTMWRNCVWNGVYFAAMHVLRESSVGGERLRANRLADAARTLLFGFTAGVAATVCNNPFDVVKSRLQARVTLGSGASPIRPGVPTDSILATLLDIWRTEGWRGLYVGFVPKALRMGIGGAVGMTAFEAAASAMALA